METSVPEHAVTNSSLYTIRTISEAVVLSWLVIPPILIVLGTIGNVMIIAVFIRTGMHKTTTGLFFSALAVSDLLGLYIGLFPNWIGYLYDIADIHGTGTFPCKLLPWLTYSVLDYSAWILIAVTVERVVATWSPLRARTICTRRVAIWYSVVCGLFLLTLNVHFIFGTEYVKIPGLDSKYACIEPDSKYRHFIGYVWPWIDITVYCLLPFTVICVGNCVIVSKVTSSRRLSVTLTAGNTERSRSSSVNRISGMTTTSLLINMSFIISTFPVCVYVIVENLSQQYFEENHAQAEMWWVFAYNFMFLNNALNAFLYCLSGTKYRRAAANLFCRITARPLSREVSGLQREIRTTTRNVPSDV